jgi:ArsR family transcriptional regulator
MKSTHTSNFLTSQVFNALAHPSRLDILDLLRDGEACVCHIQAMLDLRQAYISQHLNVLRNAGLVSSRKDGKRVYYHASNVYLFEVIDRMKTFLQLTGKLEPGVVRKDYTGQSCTCPQCTEKLPHVQIKASHA